MVSDYSAEAATYFKIFLLTCTGPFRRSRAHFEGILMRACGSVRYDASVAASKIIYEA